MDRSKKRMTERQIVSENVSGVGDLAQNNLFFTIKSISLINRRKANQHVYGTDRKIKEIHITYIVFTSLYVIHVSVNAMTFRHKKSKHVE